MVVAFVTPIRCEYPVGMAFPSVTVLLPVLNEEDHLDECLQSLADQDYPGSIEIVVADGGSTDRTLEILDMHAEDPTNLRVFPNPDRVQSAGINLAAGAARGEILVRADAHTEYATDYVSKCVETLLETGASAVGGPMIAEANTPFGRGVARAMSAKLAMGPARYRHANARTEVDTVYLGAFRKDEFLEMGGLRMLPSHVAEDTDLYFRWRSQGGRVILDPSIQSIYRPRETPRALARQFYRYGLGKADMLFVNGAWPSWRPAAPLLLLLGLVAGSALAPWSWWPLAALVALWIVALAITARFRPLVVAAGAIMHLAYGVGLWRGLFRSPAKVRAAVR